MKYQDTWVNGECIEEGNRSCADRYGIIRDYCTNNLGMRFTVCDIGANMAYFGIRLIEDFDCNVLAFEFHQYEKRRAIIEKNATVNKLMYVNRKLNLNDLQIMSSFAKFDLILALSVLHHVTEPIGQWVETMRKMSKHVIVEFAGSDSDLPEKRKEYKIPFGGMVIGHGDSHLKEGHRRPIIVYKGI